jgi:hypothetical protein
LFAPKPAHVAFAVSSRRLHGMTCLALFEIRRIACRLSSCCFLVHVCRLLRRSFPVLAIQVPHRSRRLVAPEPDHFACAVSSRCLHSKTRLASTEIRGGAVL